MGSSCDALMEVCDYLNSTGKKVGMVNVHLYRPFCPEYLINVLPETVKGIAVLDRCKEPGSHSVSLCTSMWSLRLAGTKFGSVPVIGGRYGLGSKDVGTGLPDLRCILNLMSDKPQASLHPGHHRRRDPPEPCPSPTTPDCSAAKEQHRHASSGASVLTAPLAPTKTPLRSSATTPT